MTKPQAPRGPFDVLPGDRGVMDGAVLAALMFVLYIPLGYYTDTVIYRFRQRRKQAP